MLLLLFATLVSVGDHSLSMTCTGSGKPVVVIESGFDEPAADWKDVQTRIATTTRVCVYDRAGHFASAPGPLPRTFDQMNFELKAALESAHEAGPFILAGHSFGGPLVRNFAERYPDLIAGLVLIDATHEGQRTYYGGAYHQLREGARGRAIPEPRLSGSRPGDQSTDDSEREWSSEYFARWSAHPQDHLLGSKPLVILARNARDLFGTNVDADVARERILLQLSLVSLSDDAVVTFVGFDHEMQKTIPATVADAIASVVRKVRRFHAPARQTGVGISSPQRD